MAESNGSGDIIIKGGSVQVQFDDAGYTRNGSKHDNPNKKITRIVVVDENGVEKLNSGDSQGGLRWTVTVTTR
jgi:hypothetical protein